MDLIEDSNIVTVKHEIIDEPKDDVEYGIEDDQQFTTEDTSFIVKKEDEPPDTAWLDESEKLENFEFVAVKNELFDDLEPAQEDDPLDYEFTAGGVEPFCIEPTDQVTVSETSEFGFVGNQPTTLDHFGSTVIDSPKVKTPNESSTKAVTNSHADLLCGADIHSNNHNEKEVRSSSSHWDNVCELCGAVFASVGHLRGHISTCKGPQSETANIECQCDNKSEKCVCTKHPLLKSAIVERKNTADKSDVDAVHKLGSTIPHPEYLSKNSKPKGKTNKHDKTWKCEICNKSFSCASSFYTHKHIHSGRKRFKCDFCEKSFDKRGHLKGHRRIHTGEKPYKCHFCPLTFSGTTNLRLHLRIHTGEKPFPCDICGKKFTQNTTRKQHLLTHTGEKPYKCPTCGNSFARKSYLKIHALIHTGEKRFKCEVCGKGFIFSGDLKTHKCKPKYD